MTATTAGPRLTQEEIGAFAAEVLIASGLPREHAVTVASSLVDAEARGIGSHGLTRLRIYSERLRKGMVDASAEPAVIERRGAVAIVDGRNAPGQIVAAVALEEAMRLAREHGIGAAGARRSNHCGTMAYFTRQAAEAGLIAIGMSTAPPTMVYFGGRTRAVGTNPLSIAVPRADAPPIVVDMATSATARGKIILAQQTGGTIPEGWAVDAGGHPTTDPARALEGSVLPFAGPKGSGIAMMVELLTGALVGHATGDEIGDMYDDWDREQRVSHSFIVLDPALWGAEDFADEVARFAGRVGSLPPASGHQRVLVPGELEDAALRRTRLGGLALPAAVLADLTSLAAELGLDVRIRKD